MVEDIGLSAKTFTASLSKDAQQQARIASDGKPDRTICGKRWLSEQSTRLKEEGIFTGR